MPGAVSDFIAADQWVLLAGDLDGELWMLRLRQPLPPRDAVTEYGHCVQVVWAFAPSGAGRSLTPVLLEITETFEAIVRPTLEADALAVMTAVLTYDGARQWVFYTRDARTCARRISGLIAGQDYPVEVGSFHDPGWRYLRDEIVGDKLERAFVEDAADA